MSDSIYSFFTLSVAAVVFLLSCSRDTPTPVEASIMQVETTTLGNSETQETGLLLAYETLRFRPLNYDERFAYSWHRGWPGVPITMYAVRNNDIENAVVLFTWRQVRSLHGVQFTSDLKKSFISDIVHPGWESNFYKADGFTGEIRKLFTVPSLAEWRISKDGRFLGFLRDNSDYRYNSVYIHIFDVENEAFTTKIEWHLYRHPQMSFRNGWSIFRFDGVFRIYGWQGNGHTWAGAELNLETGELKTLWDFRTPGSPFGSYVGLFGDDVSLQNRDPYISWQR